MKYNVVIERTAETDLLEILNYITNTLKEPKIASDIYRSIKNEIISLEHMPFRFQIVNEEPFRSIGVRRILVKNYSVFYIIDEEKKTVHIFRVLYARREWQNLL